MRELKNSVIENSKIVAFTSVWHIIGIENLVFGVALLVVAFQKKCQKLSLLPGV